MNIVNYVKLNCKNFFQTAFCKAVVFSGIPYLIHRFFAKTGVTIINYHDPAPELFAQQIAFLKEHYNLISLDKLIMAMQSKTFCHLPRNSLVVTFDDGHIGNKSLFPIIKDSQIPTIIYVVAEIVGSRKIFWWQVPGLSSSDVAMLKKLSDDQRKNWLKKNKGFTQDAEFFNSSALSFIDLRSYLEFGGEIGSHTLTHPILTMCSNETCILEIMNSKTLLENKFDREIKHFCFPNGSFSFSHKVILQRAGYISARTTRPGFVRHVTSPFFLPTMGISNDADLYKFILQVTGIWGCIIMFVNSLKLLGRALCGVFYKIF